MLELPVRSLVGAPRVDGVNQAIGETEAPIGTGRDREDPELELGRGIESESAQSPVRSMATLPCVNKLQSWLLGAVPLAPNSLAGAGPDRINYVADRLGHDRRYSIDSSKVRALGWEPEHDLDEALALTFAWYRENRWWWEPLK